MASTHQMRQAIDIARANSVNANNTAQYLRTQVDQLNTVISRQAQQLHQLEARLNELESRLNHLSDRGA